MGRAGRLRTARLICTEFSYLRRPQSKSNRSSGSRQVHTGHEVRESRSSIFQSERWRVLGGEEGVRGCKHRFLLNLGFEPNFPDDVNETAVFYAVRNGHKDVTCMLSERGASLDMASTEGLCRPRSMLSRLPGRDSQHHAKQESA